MHGVRSHYRLPQCSTPEILVCPKVVSNFEEIIIFRFLAQMRTPKVLLLITSIFSLKNILLLPRGSIYIESSQLFVVQFSIDNHESAILILNL